MYDGWMTFVGPAVLSGIVVLAAWTLPHFAKQGKTQVTPTGTNAFMNGDRYKIDPISMILLTKERSMWQQPSKDIRLDFSSMPRAQRADAIWGHGLMRRSMERIGEEAELLGIAVLPDKTRPSLPLLVEWALCRACLLGRILGYRPKISLEDAQNLASWGIEDGFAAELYESCKAVIEGDGYSFRPTPLTTAEMPALEALFSRCVSAEAEELHWLGYLSKTPAQGEELYLLEQTLIANGTLTDGGRTRLERARSRRLLSHGPDERRWKELIRDPVIEPEPIEPEPVAKQRREFICTETTMILPAGYFGHRKNGRAQVFRRTRAGSETGPLLHPQLEVYSHTPAGLEWGYMGSGPAQLSLAILVDYLGDVAQAQDFYQDFKLSVVVNLPQEEWTLSNDEIKDALDVIRAEYALRSESLDPAGDNHDGF